MKTSKSLNTAMLLAFVCFLFFTFTTISAETKNPIKHGKSHKSKKENQIYFEVEEPGSPNTYVLIGHGTPESGTITNYLSGCINSALESSGVASGTYTFNSTTSQMSVNVTVTPAGHFSFLAVTTPLQYGNAIISPTCGVPPQ